MDAPGKELGKAREGEDDLTDREAALVAQIANSPQNEPDFGAAGYTAENGMAFALRREPVKASVRKTVDSRIRTIGLARAVKTMFDLMDAKNPPGTRFQAAKWVAEAAGIGPQTASAQGGDKPLSEMTTAELERHVRQLAKAAEAAMKPVIDHVPPENGV